MNKTMLEEKRAGKESLNQIRYSSSLYGNYGSAEYTDIAWLI